MTTTGFLLQTTTRDSYERGWRTVLLHPGLKSTNRVIKKLWMVLLVMNTNARLFTFLITRGNGFFVTATHSFFFSRSNGAVCRYLFADPNYVSITTRELLRNGSSSSNNNRNSSTVSNWIRFFSIYLFLFLLSLFNFISNCFIRYCCEQYFTPYHPALMRWLMMTMMTEQRRCKITLFPSQN